MRSWKSLNSNDGGGEITASSGEKEETFIGRVVSIPVRLTASQKFPPGALDIEAIGERLVGSLWETLED